MVFQNGIKKISRAAVSIMLLNSDLSESPLTPNMKLAYKDVKLASESEICLTFDAVSKFDGKTYSLKALNTHSEFYQQNPNIASTLFVQEMIRLCIAHPQAVLQKDFEISGKKIAYAMHHTTPIMKYTQKTNPLKYINLPQMICDVLADVKYLLSTLELSNTINSGLQDFYHIRGLDKYYVGNWVRIIQAKDSKSNDFESVMADKQSEDREIYNLGLKVLEFSGLGSEDVSSLSAIRKNEMHNAAAEVLVKEAKLPETAKKLILKMVLRKSDDRLRIDDVVQEWAEHYADQSSKLKLTATTIQPTQNSQPSGFLAQNLPHISQTTIPDSVSRIGKGLGLADSTPGDLSSKSEIIVRNAATKTSVDYFKVKRFPDCVSGWSCQDTPDAILFIASQDIKVIGIGIYLPQPKYKLQGHVRLLNGDSDKENDTLAVADVNLGENILTPDRICRVMFNKAVTVKGGKAYTCLCKLGNGYSYRGKNGETNVKGEGGVEFEFKRSVVVSGCTTNTSLGQIPEIYYMK